MKVTREDIRSGWASRNSSPWSCPIARAIKRAAKMKWVAVWVGSIHLRGYKELETSATHERAHHAMRNAESAAKAKPFTTKLTFKPLK